MNKSQESQLNDLARRFSNERLASTSTPESKSAKTGSGVKPMGAISILLLSLLAIVLVSLLIFF